MSKFKLTFTTHGKSKTVGEYSSKESAIEAGVEYRYGEFALDKKEERREGLETRGYTFIGCNDGSLEITEVEE